MPRRNVMLGMSGGIDSCMAAILLRESGYGVVGVTLDTYLSSGYDSSVDDAAGFAGEMGIKHVVVKARSLFKREVIDYFTQSYGHGFTPNPCVRCNQAIKWPLLLEAAAKHGCNYVATGHYVDVAWVNGRYYIKKGVDQSKDQSYFMWKLDQDVLGKVIFPLGQYTKSEIRQLAVDYGLPQLERKRESNGVCFLQKDNYGDFLRKHLPSDSETLNPGLIIDHKGNYFGEHSGSAFYTPGQKRGFSNPLPPGWSVVHIDAPQNILIVGPSELLNIESVLLYDYSITPDESLWKGRKVFIRVRGIDSVPGYSGSVEMTAEGLNVHFDKPVWAVTPGQSVVIYQDDMVIGGGEVPDYYRAY